jgi:hypothetical protein
MAFQACLSHAVDCYVAICQHCYFLQTTAVFDVPRFCRQAACIELYVVGATLRRNGPHDFVISRGKRATHFMTYATWFIVEIRFHVVFFVNNAKYELFDHRRADVHH